MEAVIKGTIQNEKLEIPTKITDVLGSELKSTCMNDVWLLLTNLSDSRFEGEPLLSDGTAYSLPEKQMSALEISPGDTVRLVYSEVLNVIILQKLSNDAQNAD